MVFNPSQPHILLLGTDPGDQQWSILDYGEQLRHALINSFRTEARISLLAPHTEQLSRCLRRWRVGRGAAMYWSRYVAYPRLLRSHRANLYHFLDYGNAWLMEYLDPARTLVTCHDLIPLIFQNQRRSLLPWLSDFSYRQALRGLSRAAVILANSPCTRRDLITHLGYPADRIHVVPLGLDPGLKPPASDEEARKARAELRLPPGLLLLHVGQTAFYKNLEGLLQTLRILLDRGEPAWLIRAGAFFGRNLRQWARRLRVADRVVELGPLSRDRIRTLYHAADLLVYPSWYEGMGLPPLEALASGLPVVASNRGALPETVGDAGLIVDPADPEKIADAAERLIQDSTLRADLRARGLVRASQFRWERTAQETWKVYQSILH